MRLREWLLIVGASVIIVVIGVWSVLRYSAERDRSRAVTALKKPASLVRHEKWMEERAAEMKSAPANEASGKEEKQESSSESMNAAKRCAEYTRVLGLVEKAWSQWADAEDGPPYLFQPAGEWSADAKAAVLKLIEDNPGVLDEVRALAGLEGPITALDLSQGFKSDNRMFLWHIKRCSMLLCCAAEAEIRKGDAEQGVHDLIAVAKFADTVSDAPAWVAYDTQAELIADISDMVQDSLTQGQASPELLRELLSQLDGAYHRESLADAVGGFEHMMEQTFEDLRSTSIAEFSQKYHVDDVAGRFGIWAGKTSFVRPLIDANEAACAEVANRLVELSALPPYESAAEIGHLQSQSESISPFRGFANMKVTPVFFGTMAGQAEHEATVDLTRIGIALEIYRTENGTYPETLDAIAGQLRGSVPPDAFTGTPYVYEPHGDSFELRSEKPATGFLSGADIVSWHGGR